jgi:predicted nucleotidyltransferase
MDIIGVICEYNPFHHGHAYHLKKVKELYPNSVIILVLNGYFLERGEISILTKEDKVKISLKEGVDIVLEHPFVYGTNSADVFAESAIRILNRLKIEKLVFGSESNDIELIRELAQKQLEKGFDERVKDALETGVSYPVAVSIALGTKLNAPNDLLGSAYTKAILKNKFKIKPVSIQRTNDYHDNKSNDEIVSASNIREKLKNNIDVSKHTNYAHLANKADEQLYFNLLKHKIITDPDLSKYQTVDEGIEHRLKKEIMNASSYEDLIMKVKTKRYTYNRIQRMLTHILVGLTKNDNQQIVIEHIKLLGFTEAGKKFIHQIKKEFEIPVTRKISNDCSTQQYEMKAALVYDMIMNTKTIDFEQSNIPIETKED